MLSHTLKGRTSASAGPLPAGWGSRRPSPGSWQPGCKERAMFAGARNISPRVCWHMRSSLFLAASLAECLPLVCGCSWVCARVWVVPRVHAWAMSTGACAWSLQPQMQRTGTCILRLSSARRAGRRSLPGCQVQ